MQNTSGRFASLPLMLAMIFIVLMAIPACKSQRNRGYEKVDQGTYTSVAAMDRKWATHVKLMLNRHRIPSRIESGEKYWVMVPELLKPRAADLIRQDAAKYKYKVFYP